jgi:hypothetical protein
MNTKAKTWASSGIATAGVAAIIIATSAIVGAVQAQPAPTPTHTAVTVERPADNVDISTTSPSSERALARQQAEAEAAALAAAAQAAAQAEVERVAAEQAVQQEQPVVNEGGGSSPVDQPAPAPVRCPAGSSANSNDGVNDTSCYPDICFSIAVPDPGHPECDAPFRP